MHHHLPRLEKVTLSISSGFKNPAFKLNFILHLVFSWSQNNPIISQHIVEIAWQQLTELCVRQRNFIIKFLCRNCLKLCSIISHDTRPQTLMITISLSGVGVRATPLTCTPTACLAEGAWRGPRASSMTISTCPGTWAPPPTGTSTSTADTTPSTTGTRWARRDKETFVIWVITCYHRPLTTTVFITNHSL